MSIVDISIRNFRSLKDINIKIDEEDSLSCLLGKNGTGKTNILNAIKYFYDNMFSNYGDSDVLDSKNPYIQTMEISITYDFSNLMLKRRLNQHLDDSINKLKIYFNDEEQILVKMKQDKKGEIKWYPKDIDKDRDLLKAISNIFPIYHINTRDIDLVNWEVLWDIISDLSKKPSEISNEEYNKLLDDAFEGAFRDKYEKSRDMIDDIFESEGVGLNQHDHIDRYKNILAVRFGGSEFLSGGNRLDYYSDGLNSFKFLIILLKIISELISLAWKEPIILIDEPEIGLHPSYITDFVEVIKENVDESVNLFITTHSSDLICELMKNAVNTNIYRTSMIDHYTSIEKMDGNIDKNERHRLTINEARCYFADAIVAVEGASDIEVFSNPKLRELFPKLKEIELYSMNSDNVGYGFISPIERKVSIPTLLIVDMDKIIQPRINNYKKPIKYRINRDKLMNPLSSRKIRKEENLLYNQSETEEKNIKSRRESIEKAIKTKSFQIKCPGYYIDDSEYINFITSIQDYCQEYNTFPFRTTIEGALITLNNYKDFLRWIKKEDKINIEMLDKILEEHANNHKYRTSMLRLIASGKYNSIHKLDKLNIKIKGELMSLEKEFGKKTSGWIDSWISFYFTENLNDIEDNNEKRKVFKEDFKELSKVIETIEKLI